MAPGWHIDDDGQYWQTVAQWEELQDAEPTKVCSLCAKPKPLSEFPTCKALRDGRRNECKRCTKEYIRAWRDRNFEQVRERDKAYAAQPHVREAVYKRNAVWRENNPQKRRAHYIFHRALKAGLIKPQPCWICGERAEAHHPDYDEPLLVVWLCKPHHKQTHALI